MKNFLLKSPHWLVFIVLVVVPFVLTMAFYIYWVVNMISFIENGSNGDPFAHAYGPSDPDFIFGKMKFLLLIYLPSLLGLFLTEMWMYHLANASNNSLPEELKVNLKTFNVLVYVPAFVFALIILGMYILFSESNAFGNGGPENLSLIVVISILIIIGYLFMIFAIFYSFVFAARAYKTAVLNKKVTFSDYVGEFFCLWFSFVGIWIMQPKINQIANGTLHIDAYDNTSSHLIE